jgi:Uma2 family endonuclease
MVAVPSRRRFTVEEYYQMAAAGILTERDRVELIDGEIIEMSPIGDRHAASVKRCLRVFSRVEADRVLVSVQDPIDLDPYNEPEPDVALLRPRADDYARGKPRPTDILLLIEVADTSLDHDRKTKLPHYAAAGVRETWLLDLPGDALEAHREPRDDGYAVVRRYRRGERVAPEALPDVAVAVEDLLPPPDVLPGEE